MIRYSKTDNSIRNIVWGITNKILVVFWPFIIRNLMIRKLGIEYLGLSSLFASVLQMMSLAELGFGSAMVYAMYRPIAEENYSEINALLQFYKIVYRGIGFMILLSGIGLSPFLRNLINGPCPSQINLYTLYFIYLSNTVCSYWLFAYKNSLLTAYHRVDIISKITGITHMCMYIVQCIVLIVFQNYYIYAIVLPICTIINNLCTAIVVNKMFPQITEYGKISKETRQEIKKRVIALLGHKLGGVITNSTDNIVISAFLGLTVLAIYNNYYQIIASLIGMFSIINNSLIAGLGNSIVTDSIKKNYCVLKGLTFGNVWVIGWCSICLLCLYQPFIKAWVGDIYLLPCNVIVLFAVYFYIWKFKDMLSIYKDAAGMWWNDRWKPIVYCIVNIVVSVALVNIIGVSGVIIGTIISQLFVAIPWETIAFFQGYIYEDEFLRGQLKTYTYNMIQYSLAIIVIAIITYLCCVIINFTSVYNTLVYRSIICLIVPNLIYWFIYHKTDEYIFIMEKLKKYVEKIKNR